MSRYTDRDGWWLFGLAAGELDGLAIDLLSDPPAPSSAVMQVTHAAIVKFRDQCGKHGFPLARLSTAELTFAAGRKYKTVSRICTREGHDFLLTVSVRTESGSLISRTRRLFVAPHDPSRERRRAQAK